jgi:hypothetical protein
MPTGDPTHRPAGALRSLRSRWFATSRPLAVDDEPQWTPASDAAAERTGAESELDPPSTSVPLP